MEARLIVVRSTADLQLGDFDDAVILRRYGETPDDLTSFTMLG